MVFDIKRKKSFVIRWDYVIVCVLFIVVSVFLLVLLGCLGLLVIFCLKVLEIIRIVLLDKLKILVVDEELCCCCDMVFVWMGWLKLGDYYGVIFSVFLI